MIKIFPFEKFSLPANFFISFIMKPFDVISFILAVKAKDFRLAPDESSIRIVPFREGKSLVLRWIFIFLNQSLRRNDSFIFFIKEVIFQWQEITRFSIIFLLCFINSDISAAVHSGHKRRDNGLLLWWLNNRLSVINLGILYRIIPYSI